MTTAATETCGPPASHCSLESLLSGVTALWSDCSLAAEPARTHACAEGGARCPELCCLSRRLIGLLGKMCVVSLPRSPAPLHAPPPLLSQRQPPLLRRRRQLLSSGRRDRVSALVCRAFLTCSSRWASAGPSLLFARGWGVCVWGVWRLCGGGVAVP